LVINSPRLIADSYVLLRLLMPRHPPCALKNLTTHTCVNTYLFERTIKNQHHHTPKQGPAASDPGSIISKKLLSYKDARVHYVVLKQQPHHTPTPPTAPITKPKPKAKVTQTSTAQRFGYVQETRHNTLHPRRDEKVVVPGPNSVPNA
jgi:hypothetical protein